MGMPAMKVHQFARAFREHEPGTLACKRLRPLAPKVASTSSAATATTGGAATFNLKSFIRPESGPRRTRSEDHQKQECSQVETTRWNPTQEQIGILEMLYKDGMRTPNAQQIEQITAQLANYGKIEGKNVFYWFQNHKARERQKQKRNSLALSHTRSTSSTSLLLSPGEGVEEGFSCISQKRKCCLREEEEDEEGDRTLKLFPLHPEGIKDDI